MRKNKTPFEKEKIAFTRMISKEMLIDTKLEFDHYSEADKGIIISGLSSYIYTNMADKRKLVYYCNRPSFFDWLLRRTKKVVFNLEVKDLLLNPPKTNGTKRIYIVNVLK